MSEKTSKAQDVQGRPCFAESSKGFGVRRFDEMSDNKSRYDKIEVSKIRG